MKKWVNMFKIISSILFVALVFSIACGTYGYPCHGGVPGLLPTISIPTFKNKADFFDPKIGLWIAEELHKRFQKDGAYELVDKNADIIVEGNIIDYQMKTSSLFSPYTSQTNSLTIKVELEADFLNDPQKNLNKIYTDFVEYNANRNFTKVNDSLNRILSEKIADQIYYEMALQW